VRSGLFRILASAFVMATAVVGPSGARAANADGFLYDVDGGSVTVLGCAGSCPTSLEIPATLGGLPVRSIGANAFNNGALASVTIPASVTSIGDSAFGNNDLTTLEIPGAVTTIGAGAFASNALNALTIRSGVTTIGSYAFAENALTSLQLPDSVTTIGANAFATNALNALTFGDGVTTIGSYAFANNALTHLNIPSSVTLIDTYAFAGNGLVELTIPSSVITIGAYSFSENSIASLNLPDALTAIGDGAFYNNLLTDLTLPSALLEIGNAAFSSNLLVSVTIPGSVVTIGDYAFSENAIESLTLPDSVTTIGTGAFHRNSIAVLNLPNAITSIGDSAFDTNRLGSVVIPDSVRSIGSYAFFRNLITTLSIPATVSSIGSFAFANNALSGVTFLGAAPTEGSSVFTGNVNLPYVVRYRGELGWHSMWSDVAVVVFGTTPPETFLNRMGPSPSGAVVNFTLSSLETVTFECNLDDAGWVPCASDYTTPELIDGLHVLLVHAINVDGSTDPTPAREEWRSDTTPPETVLDSAPEAISHDSVAHFSFSAIDGSAVTFECALDGGTFFACVSPYTTNTLSLGIHTFTVRATDATGRVDDSPAMHTWEVLEDISGLPPTDRSIELILLDMFKVLALLGLAILALRARARRLKVERATRY